MPAVKAGKNISNAALLYRAVSEPFHSVLGEKALQTTTYLIGIVHRYYIVEQCMRLTGSNLPQCILDLG